MEEQSETLLNAHHYLTNNSKKPRREGDPYRSALSLGRYKPNDRFVLGGLGRPLPFYEPSVLAHTYRELPSLLDQRERMRTAVYICLRSIPFVTDSILLMTILSVYSDSRRSLFIKSDLSFGWVIASLRATVSL